jgi:hypothetical protein
LGSWLLITSEALACEPFSMTGGDPNEMVTVQRMFVAFAVRDLDALLETVHPRSRWVYYGAIRHAAIQRSP